jgi:hypothetical protein
MPAVLSCEALFFSMRLARARPYIHACMPAVLAYGVVLFPFSRTSSSSKKSPKG